MDENPLIALPVVLGPTGSGKSELAFESLGVAGEIVNCDSVQIYRGFQIGTAKVPEAERRGIPHHLIDLAEPGELFTAGDYARAARTVLREIAARGRIPVVVGGTGFYLRALLEGFRLAPRATRRCARGWNAGSESGWKLASDSHALGSGRRRANSSPTI